MNQSSNAISLVKDFGSFIIRALRYMWQSAVSVVGSVIVGLLVIVVLISLFVSGSDSTFSRKVVRAGSAQEVVVVHLNGPIVDRAGGSDPLSFDSASIAVDRVSRLLDELVVDNSVEAIVLRLNSPGGGVVASDELYQKIRLAAKQKPVYVSISEMAASGGYYLAVGADKIIAHPSSILGSIGVIAYFPNFGGLFEKVGVELEVLRTGEFKDLGSPGRSMSAAERDMIQTLLDTALDDFIEAVAEGRDQDILKVASVADGRIVSGKEALELGLIDGLGTLDDALDLSISDLNLDNPTITEVSTQSFWESLLTSRLGLGQILSGSLTRPQGLYYLSDWY